MQLEHQLEAPLEQGTTGRGGAGQAQLDLNVFIVLQGLHLAAATIKEVGGVGRR